jgi:hypothetical protein
LAGRLAEALSKQGMGSELVGEEEEEEEEE